MKSCHISHLNIGFRSFLLQLSAVRKRFENSAPQYQLPPCKEAKVKVLECYKANAKGTLNCSDVVAGFEQCVQTHRSNLLNEKYGSATPIAAAS